jgi:hypothetical protein
MIQLNSRNIVSTDTIIKTLILGVLFGLSVYIIKEFAVFSWYLGLPSDTVIMGLVNLERETWLEFIGDILFGITIALIVRIGYERYIRRFKFSVKEN